ncbi:MAG: ABC transporter permease, partial [Gemmatimonadota bacterium]
MRSLRRLFRLATGRSSIETDLDDEFALHLDLKTDELVADGMSRTEARRVALASFGNLTAIRGAVRSIDHRTEAAMRRTQIWDELRQDLAFGIRTLRKAPGFALVALATLAIGVGATATMFTVVNGVLLRRLPYPNADRMTMVWTTPAESPGIQWPFSAANYLDLAQQSRTLEHVAAFRSASFTLQDGDRSQLVSSVRVTGEFFNAVGEKPFLGRALGPEDDRFGAPKVAVISDALWRRQFGADSGVVNRQVLLSRVSYTVVGVMPPAFHFPRGAELPSGLRFATRTDLWAPLALSPEDAARRGSQNLAVLGLARAGTSQAQISAELNAFWLRIVGQFKPLGFLAVMPVALARQATAPVRPALLILMAAVGLLLVIACTNVSNLLLTRTAARAQEVALRSALGADQRRLIRQFVAENLTLSVAGGLLGCVVAVWGKSFLLGLVPSSMPRVDDIALDWRVLAVTVMTVIVVGLGFGLAAAAHAVRGSAAAVLNEASAKTAGGRTQARLRRGLIIGEVAISLVLLSGAGLLGRSFVTISNEPTGFESHHALTAEIVMPIADSTNLLRGDPGWLRFYDQLEAGLRPRPGVVAVGGVTSLPLSGAWENTGFQIEGAAAAQEGKPQVANYAAVTDGYFAALSIPLVGGRGFESQDRANPNVVVISAVMARQYWGAESPIGRRIQVWRPEWLTIVGVVADVRQAQLDQPPVPTIYLPVAGFPEPSLAFVVRTTGAPATAAAALQDIVHSIDPSVGLNTIQTMDEVTAGSLAQRRFNLIVLGLFAAAALVLAVIGLYGVISFLVAGETRAMGVRLALGAEPADLVRRVVLQGLGLAGVGVGVGLVGALAMGRALSGLVYRVSPNDPLTLGVAAAALLLVAAVASWVPARRAMR